MLTIKQQERLTEFLGCKWHGWSGDPDYCACGAPDYVCLEKNLDFSDWRVVGRLIEKAVQSKDPLQNLLITKGAAVFSAQLRRVDPVDTIIATGQTPQLAICFAIDTWLHAKGEGK